MISPRGCRIKGHSFEREVAAAFREAFPGEEIRRGLQTQDGAVAPDVIVPGLWIEAKRGKRTNIRGALRQAAEARGGRVDLTIVAITKDDRAEALATLSLEDFVRIYKRAGLPGCAVVGWNPDACEDCHDNDRICGTNPAEAGEGER